MYIYLPLCPTCSLVTVELSVISRTMTCGLLLLVRTYSFIYITNQSYLCSLIRFLIGLKLKWTVMRITNHSFPSLCHLCFFFFFFSFT
ncbi:hypothetical protein DFJ63DRAFT_317243, partial [Scheffersomyces coipomensis]|uniref:uncharacterized protein n=1 Tax=Scheffersomyces coipomensis TaxID=1788519 RepID=UPI00315CDE0A